MKRLIRREANPAAEVAPGSPLLSRVFSARGVSDASGIDHRLKFLVPPTTLRGLDVATSLLSAAVQQDKRILIVGDFDADGATSSVLLVSGLRAMGATHVDYLVPNRFEYGYGLTPEIVDAARRFDPELIITVDNGISSVAGVAHARSLGIMVLITDHHLPGADLPDADAIVNPNQAGCEFPSKHLAGVGVAFYLLSALRSKLRELDWFESRALSAPNLADYLDLVALGTIADVVPLDYNNRILVQEGIRRIRAGRTRPGLLAMLEVAGIDKRWLVSRDLAFGIAPRLNAAGRLEDISLGIECLLSQDKATGIALATRLDTLNQERREIENEMKTQALGNDGVNDASVESSWIGGRDAVGVCLFHENWHQGVVGIVASRVKERIHRPVIAFARAGENELKGSARSISGLHIRDALDNIAAKNPGLVIKFGGHAMAAGLSLEPNKLKQFSLAFDQEAKRWLGAADLEQTIFSDGELGDAPTIELVRELQEAAPWGQAFPEPVFDDEFEILEQRIVGGHHLKLKLAFRDGAAVDAIAFNHPGLIESRYRRLAYRVEINSFRGRDSVQLVVEASDLA